MNPTPLPFTTYSLLTHKSLTALTRKHFSANFHCLQFFTTLWVEHCPPGTDFSFPFYFIEVSNSLLKSVREFENNSSWNFPLERSEYSVGFPSFYPLAQDIHEVASKVIISLGNQLFMWIKMDTLYWQRLYTSARHLYLAMVHDLRRIS